MIAILFIRKAFSQTYLNPTGILCGVWILIVALMSFLAPSFFFSYDVAFNILFFVIFFFLGEFIVALSNKKDNRRYSYIEFNDGNKRRLKKYVTYFSFFSLLGSLFYLKAFVDHFGSFQAFFTAGALIREDLFGGGIIIPSYALIPALFSYTAINLAMVHYVRYGFSWVQAVPFLSVIIMSVSQASRAGMVIVIFQIISAIIFRLLMKNDKKLELKLLKIFLLIVPILFTVFTLIDSFRSQNFSMSDDKMSKTNETFYIYTFGGVSGFSTYLETIYSSDNLLTGGRYTFSSLYDLLGIAKAEAGVYDEYLKISPNNTANIYSIFRPLMEDFGFYGMVSWAFILGMISNFNFRKALNGSLISISISISIYIYLMFSFEILF